VCVRVRVFVCDCELQCVAVCCSVLLRLEVPERSAPVLYLRVLQCVAVCCSALQCVAVCCSVLQLQEPERSSPLLYLRVSATF